MADSLALIGQAKVGSARLGWPADTTEPPATIRADGGCWGLVQDPAILQAIQDAADAKNAADTAQDAADSALTMAGSNTRVYYSTDAPSGVPSTDNAVWRQLDGADNVVGRWRWDGDAWVSDLITTDVIDNLDVGKLTVGTGVIAQLVAQHIAAQTATFQTADIKNLFATTGTLSEAVIDKLFTDVVKARKITADMLLVGSGGNLVANGDGELGAGVGWAENLILDTADVPEAMAGSFKSEPGSGTVRGSYDRFTVNPDTEYLFQLWIKADLPNSKLYVELRDQDEAHGTNSYPVEGALFGSSVNGPYPIELYTVPTEWTKMEAAVITKSGTYSLHVGGIYFNHSSGTEQGATVHLAGLSIRPRVDTSIVATGAIIAPHIRASEEMSAKLGEFLRVNTRMLEADAIDGMVITGAIFQSPGDGAGFQLTEGGYTSRDADGNVTVRLPADGSTAQFRGDLEAKSLTASGRVSFQAPENEIASGAALVLESGVQAPASPPTVGTSYETVQFPQPPERADVSGLAYAAGLWWRGVNVLGTGEGDRIEGITSAGEVAVTKAVTVDPRGGIAAIGDELFVLGKRHDRPNTERWVEVYGVTGGAATYKRRWEYTSYGTGTYQPGIGTDGTNVLIAQCEKGGNLNWSRWNKTTGAFMDDVNTFYPMKSDVVGVHKGAGDFAQPRVVVSKPNGATETFKTTGAHYEDFSSWYSAGREGVVGLTFMGGKFVQQTTSSKLVTYSGFQNTEGDTNDWWLVQTWVGPSGEETMAGPPQRFTFMRRSELQLASGEMPPGVTGAKFYLGRGAGGPPDVQGFHRLATTTGSSVRITDLPSTWESEIPPPMVNTFANTDPGLIKSRIGGFVARGDGSGSWGPLTFNPDDTLSGVPVVKSGSLVITPSAANLPTPVTVTFPGSPFLTAPIVAVTAETSSPGRLVPGVSYMDSTTTSVTLYLTRTNTTPTGVSWIATGEGVLE